MGGWEYYAVHHPGNALTEVDFRPLPCFVMEDTWWRYRHTGWSYIHSHYELLVQFDCCSEIYAEAMRILRRVAERAAASRKSRILNPILIWKRRHNYKPKDYPSRSMQIQIITSNGSKRRIFTHHQIWKQRKIFHKKSKAAQKLQQAYKGKKLIIGQAINGFLKARFTMSFMARNRCKRTCYCDKNFQTSSKKVQNTNHTKKKWQ